MCCVCVVYCAKFHSGQNGPKLQKLDLKSVFIDGKNYTDPKNLNAYEFVVSHIKNGNGEYDHQQIGSFMKIVNPQFAKSSYYLERCQ